MSQLDRQKEWVGVWKIAVFFLLGSEFGLIGYIFNINEIQLILLIMALLLLLFGIIVTAIYLKKEIDKLEDINE